ncbi:MAG: peptidyl-prolyl cis-trans isomerase [bacterium]
MKKLSKKNLNSLFFVLLALSVVSCGKDKERPDEYIAKVGDSYLTNTEVDSALGSYKHNKKFRTEYVRQWIEKEVLFKEAIEEDITDEEDFSKTINDTRRELAGVKLIQKILEENQLEFSEDELKYFFINNQDEFRKPEVAYVINSIRFNDELKAINFRSALIESDWNSAFAVIHDDKSVVSFENEKLLYVSEVPGLTLARIIEGLNTGEISIILENEPGNFLIVQMVEIIQPNQTPDFKYIQDNIRERFVMIQKKKLLQDYLEGLYSKYEVEFAEK